MEYTKNYQLPSWVKEDRIRMEDFNDMTGKIDAGILSRLGPVEEIKRLELTASLSNNDLLLDLSDVDWNQWSVVLLDLHARFSADPETDYLYLNLSGVTLIGYTADTFTKRVPGPVKIFFFPGRDASRPISAVSFPGGDVCISYNTYRELTSAQVGSNKANLTRYMGESGNFTLYGIH